MGKVKAPVISLLLLSAAIVIQQIVIYNSNVIGQQISTPESSIIVAKASLLRKYGEKEIQIEFDANETHSDYWEVMEYSEGEVLGYPPCILVRKSDGRVVDLWRNRAFVAEEWLGILFDFYISF